MSEAAEPDGGPVELLDTMKPLSITRRYRLADTPHRLADADGVLSAASLGAVSEASALVAQVRGRCAAHLRALRQRQQRYLTRQRAACEADVLARAAQLSQQLQDERRKVRETAAALVAQVARDALKRLMVELPEAWPARSSVQLVLAEWTSLELKDEAVLHLHPDDLALMAPDRSPLPWTLMADPKLPRGACVLSHAAGTVRADFQANVEALQAALSPASTPPPATPSSSASSASSIPASSTPKDPS
ncbi:FliH/SctL family protein [Roseateles sp. SL47]|uniref:FliH/SctL family protein n=1 Tax=Roseateles sp. SL47 TaxID=2995138 RepID=UPI00226E39FA|nr:FliH/SctL family protein [Roseateles sp. SL47]WAC75175.1 FliH/SctL family protein [Roseateles sp. SL47]